MAKTLLSSQIIKRLNKLKRISNGNEEIKRAYDSAMFTYTNCRMALIDIATKYPNEDFARETYERRAKQLLGEIIGLDKLYVREFHEEPIYLDMNNPTKIVKILSAYEVSHIFASSN